MLRTLATALATGLLLTLSACSGGDPAASFVGSWGSQEPGQPNLTITEKLEISGTDGCNHLSGTGSINGETLRFGNMVSTEMACPDIMTWLGGAYGATVSGGVMTITDLDDVTIGTLDQAPTQ